MRLMRLGTLILVGLAGAGCVTEERDGPTDQVAVGEQNYVLADKHTQRIEGDFNGDGRGDLIVVTSAGSFQFLGQAGGGFVQSPWARLDLKRFYVDYYTGDFNGDGCTDLIVVDEFGSSEFFGNRNTSGGFTQGSWKRTDLKFQIVEYTPGNFNGDNFDDFIVTTAAGSFEFFGKGTGGFIQDSWARTDLTLGNVKYTVGNFDGDFSGTTDLIVSTAAGSFEFFGLSSGGFQQGDWTRTDLSMNKVYYTVGDFNGDGRHDLIISTIAGSFQFLGLKGGGFFQTSWARTDLPSGVRYVTGDFNGDTRTDFIVSTSAGAYEYLGLAGSNGGFDQNVWIRTDLGTSTARFTSGDFTGDRKTDFIVITDAGTYEYLGQEGAGFVPDVWYRTDLKLTTALYY